MVAADGPAHSTIPAIATAHAAHHASSARAASDAGTHALGEAAGKVKIVSVAMCPVG